MKKYVLCCLIAIVVCLCVENIIVSADTGDVYILTTSVTKASELIEKYKTDTDTNEEDSFEETESENTEQTGVITDGQITVELYSNGDKVLDVRTGENNQVKAQISIRNSPSSSKWPQDLMLLYNCAKSDGMIDVTIVSDERNMQVLAYMVSKDVNRVGCIYMTNANEIQVYLTDVGDTSYITNLNKSLTGNREMTGQVELRDLTTEDMRNLFAIKNELELMKEDNKSTTVIGVITKVTGILIIVYAVLFLLAYMLDSLNPFNIDLEFFYLITFGRWHAIEVSDITNSKTKGLFAAKYSLKLTGVFIHVSLYIIIGFSLIYIKWGDIAMYVYELVTQ